MSCGRTWGDAALLRQVIAAFLERAPSTLAELRDGAARGDTPAVLAAAHAMKGTSATLGARTLSERCAELERLARAGSLPDVVAQAAAIEACYVAVDRALRTKVGDAGACALGRAVAAPALVGSGSDRDVTPSPIPRRAPLP